MCQIDSRYVGICACFYGPAFHATALSSELCCGGEKRNLDEDTNQQTQ